MKWRNDFFIDEERDFVNGICVVAYDPVSGSEYKIAHIIDERGRKGFKACPGGIFLGLMK